MSMTNSLEVGTGFASLFLAFHALARPVAVRGAVKAWFDQIHTQRNAKRAGSARLGNS